MPWAPRHTFQMGGCTLHVRSTPLLTVLGMLAHFYCYRIIAAVGIVPIVFDHGAGYINTFTWIWPSKTEENISKEPPSIAPWLRKPPPVKTPPQSHERPPHGRGQQGRNTGFESLTKTPQSKSINSVVF